MTTPTVRPKRRHHQPHGRRFEEECHLRGGSLAGPSGRNQIRKTRGGFSAKPFDNMLAKDLARARPEAAEFVQSDGRSEKSALLAATMDQVRGAGPAYAKMSDLQLAKLIVFGIAPSGA